MLELLNEVSQSMGYDSWNDASRSENIIDPNIIPSKADELYKQQLVNLRPLIHGKQSHNFGTYYKRFIWDDFQKISIDFPDLINHELIGMVSYDGTLLLSKFYISFNRFTGNYYMSESKHYHLSNSGINYSTPEQTTYENITALFNKCEKLEVL